MSTMRYGAKLNVLLVTKGHPFARDAFHAMFDAIPDCAVTAVEHPAAEVFFDPAQAAPYDAIVLYDMPGIDFAQRDPLRFVPPPDALKRGWRALLDSGKGIVFMHHAIAGKLFSNEGWTHPRGSNLAAWSQRVGRSQLATILGGDGPAAYENPGLRRLLENTIRWVADETARARAAG